MNRAIRRHWPLAAAICALAYLGVMEYTGALPERQNLVRLKTEGVMQADPAQITRVTVSARDATAVLVRQSDGWNRQAGGATIDAELRKTLERAVKFMHTAAPVRKFKQEDLPQPGMAQFGLEQPSLSVTLENAGGVVLAADFGNSDSDQILRYMRLKSSTDIYLMSGFVGKEWDAVASRLRQ